VADPVEQLQAPVIRVLLAAQRVGHGDVEVLGAEHGAGRHRQSPVAVHPPDEDLRGRLEVVAV
jgi:hypothetical protein